MADEGRRTKDEGRKTKATNPSSFVLRPSSHTIFFAFNLVVIFTLALSVRLAYWRDARGYAVGADEPDYVIPAQTLVREGRYVDTYISNNRIWTRVPLTSIFFAGSFLFVPDSLAAGAQGDDAALMEPRYDALNIAQIIVSLVTIALTMLLAARIFPHKARAVMLVAGYISALYPPLASSPAQRALSEPLSIMLIFAALYTLSFWAPDGSRRRMLGVAALTGALLGIAALARSVGIAFLPFACLWFFIVYRAARPKSAIGAPSRPPKSKIQDPKSSIPILSAGLAILTCFVAIAPWTYYNYRQYGSFLLLETANTTAYWHYHNFRREDEDATLRRYPNPADRLSVIVKEGTSNILEYPDQAIGSAIFAFFYAWHLESNSAVLVNAWDMTQRDPDVPDLLHSDVAFILVGLAGMAGFVGVGLRRPVGVAGRTLLIINLWLLVMLLLGVVVPYDGRYRLPAAPALIILASGLLVTADWRAVFSPRRAWAIVRSHPKVVAATLVLCMWVLVGAYTPNIPPLFRSLYQAWRGDLAASFGDVPTSFGRYAAAEAAFPNFYWPYRHEADAYRHVGDDDQARALYARARDLNPDDPYGLLGFADLAARHPAWQLTPDEKAWLDRDESEWRGNPWNSFQPTAADAVDIGAGRDIGYIEGFYNPDQSRAPSFDYRWSRGRSTIRIPVPVGATYTAVTLRMSAPGIGPQEPTPVTLSINGAPPTTLNVPSGWADYTVPLPQAVRQGDTVTINLTSALRSPAKLQPGSDDNRNLGVGIDRVTLVSK